VIVGTGMDPDSYEQLTVMERAEIIRELNKRARRQ
jgi:hypothetical protein